VRRVGLTAEQVEDSANLIFTWEQGLVFTRWRLKERLSGSVVMKEPAPGCTNRERLVATGLSLSVCNARIAAQNWLAIHRLAETDEAASSDSESVAELLRHPDCLAL
jgi:hypothetical protein